jgi:hypothetical protein
MPTHQAVGESVPSSCQFRVVDLFGVRPVDLESWELWTTEKSQSNRKPKKNGTEWPRLLQNEIC